MDDDILDSHAGRGGGRRTTAIVAALVVVGAVLAWRADDPPRRTAAIPSPSPSPSPTPEESTRSVPLDLVAPPAPGPTHVDVPAATAYDPLVVLRDGRLVLLDGPRPRDVAPGAFSARLFRLRGGTVVSSVFGYEVGSVRFVADGGGSTVVGSGLVAFPALDGVSMWIGEETRDGMVLRRHDVRTGAIRQQTTLPPKHVPVAEVATGIAADADRSEMVGTSVVWSPARHRVVRRLRGRVAAAAGRYVVTGPVLDCRLGCYSRVDVVTGRSAVVEGLFLAGSFPTISPDGRWVVAYADEHGGSPWHLVVRDMRLGVTTTVRGADVTADTVAGFAWAPDSRRLYVSLLMFLQGTGQVLVWEPRTGTLRSVSEKPVESLAVA
ncbi:MAG TPA: hypothetical protein VGX28_14265 [Frankiaceae bacterium]|jgi:hypothetical protein|nr:hypothetical protein [Frankiaceae bacterium]